MLVEWGGWGKPWTMGEAVGDELVVTTEGGEEEGDA